MRSFAHLFSKDKTRRIQPTNNKPFQIQFGLSYYNINNTVYKVRISKHTQYTANGLDIKIDDGHIEFIAIKYLPDSRVTVQDAYDINTKEPKDLTLDSYKDTRKNLETLLKKLINVNEVVF